MGKKSPWHTDEEFAAAFEKDGPSVMARDSRIALSNIYHRRRRVEKRLDRRLVAPGAGSTHPVFTPACEYPSRVPFKLQNGVVLIGSDAHYWPTERTAGHRAFVQLARELQPAAIVVNGDLIDGARISRHPPIGWDHTPTVAEERDEVEDRLTDLEKAAPKARRFWELGNHDYRFENKLAAQAPQFEGVPGFSLKEHFPKWELGISLWVNDQVVIKHRFKGGVHATHNNTLWAGKTMVTGHLHSLKVTPFSDYNGIRWGVDSGTLAEPYGPQFHYSEDNPLNHRSGLIVLTFHQGQLLWPEIVRIVDKDSFDFRGKIYKLAA